MLPRRVIVMRHGERVDDLFPGWIEKSTLAGFYRPYDLNMVLSTSTTLKTWLILI